MTPGYDADMRIFVYEYFSSGVLSSRPGAESLRAEGWAMLSAVARDLQQCPGVQTVMLLDPELTGPGEIMRCVGPDEEALAFRSLARSADRTLVIAPETGGILEERCRWAEAEGSTLPGPSPEAVRLTADKLALADHLRARRVPTPPTCVASAAEACPYPYPVVVKPRDGAGSVATALIPSPERWRALADARAVDGWQGTLIVQPIVPGKAASVALLAGRRIHALLPAEQILALDGSFQYLGGSAPLPEAESARVRRLAEQAVASVPGMRGFVGVDVVLGEEPTGRDDVVIEINPRLTTSYVGLRHLARFNLAAAMLAVAEGNEPPPMTWRSGTVRWRADGRIEST